MAEEQRYGVPTEEQLAKINALTKRPFSAEEVFVFDTKMVGDALIPGRYIKLTRELLEVYTKDAQAGNVAFQLNHRWASFFDTPKGVFNMGRVFDSWLAEADDVEGETVAQFGSVYIPRGRTKDGVSTDEVIQSIEDGSLRDVSVGIGWEVSECSICGESYFSRKCEHWAGREYDGKLCYIIAKPPGDQFELSGVFAGAYPTAEVLSEMGRPAGMELVAEDEELKRLEEGTRILALYGRNNINLWVPKDAAKKRASFIIAEKLDKEGGDELAEEQKEVLEQTATEQSEPETLVETPENPAEVHSEAKLEVAEENVLTLNRKAVVEALGKEMDAESILRLAKDGQILRAELIEDTLEWGVRAQGNAFAREFFTEMLNEPGRTIEGIKNLREQFKAQAKEALKAGRTTVPMDKKAAKVANVPDEVFKTR